jgi:hypothetical protein
VSPAKPLHPRRCGNASWERLHREGLPGPLPSDLCLTGHATVGPTVAHGSAEAWDEDLSASLGVARSPSCHGAAHRRPHAVGALRVPGARPTAASPPGAGPPGVGATAGPPGAGLWGGARRREGPAARAWGARGPLPRVRAATTRGAGAARASARRRGWDCAHAGDGPLGRGPAGLGRGPRAPPGTRALGGFASRRRGSPTRPLPPAPAACRPSGVWGACGAGGGGRGARAAPSQAAAANGRRGGGQAGR